MSVIKAGIRGSARKNLDKALAQRLEFSTGGALRGQVRDSDWAPAPGMLNSEERKTMEFDQDTRKIVYVVYSYSTPIAWVCADGHTHKVQQKFSVTTSRHQGFLYLLDK